MSNLQGGLHGKGENAGCKEGAVLQLKKIFAFCIFLTNYSTSQIGNLDVNYLENFLTTEGKKKFYVCNTDLEGNLLTVEPDATVNCRFLGQTTARQRPDNDQTTGRQRLYNGQTTTRQRPDKDQTTARQRPDNSQTTARQRPDNSQKTARQWHRQLPILQT